ncbi:MAG: hypothetical protein EOM55_03455 [Clostridia bacterium]|nr:hypothetical protein [Clostridia bacterium]
MNNEIKKGASAKSILSILKDFDNRKVFDHSQTNEEQNSTPIKRKINEEKIFLDLWNDEKRRNAQKSSRSQSETELDSNAKDKRCLELAQKEAEERRKEYLKNHKNILPENKTESKEECLGL